MRACDRYRYSDKIGCERSAAPTYAYTGRRLLRAPPPQPLLKSYRSMVGICKERTATRGEKVHRCLPGFLPHAEECLAEICSYLAQRYPECFRVTRVQYVPEDSATHGDSIAGQEAGAVASITNRITGDAYDFVRLRREEGEAWSPMKYAGSESPYLMPLPRQLDVGYRLTQCLMHALQCSCRMTSRSWWRTKMALTGCRQDRYASQVSGYGDGGLSGVARCDELTEGTTDGCRGTAPDHRKPKGSWRLEDKIGRTLHEIHVNGDVPQFREKLKFSMER